MLIYCVKHLHPQSSNTQSHIAMATYMYISAVQMIMYIPYKAMLFIYIITQCCVYTLCILPKSVLHLLWCYNFNIPYYIDTDSCVKNMV